MILYESFNFACPMSFSFQDASPVIDVNTKDTLLVLNFVGQTNNTLS